MGRRHMNVGGGCPPLPPPLTTSLENSSFYSLVIKVQDAPRVNSSHHGVHRLLYVDLRLLLRSIL